MNQHVKKILIIDDDERNIFALSAVLKARKFDCVAAGSGNEGMKMLKQMPDIGIALVDMMMPGMDGYELIAHIRKEAQLSNIPLVAVTAQAMQGDRERCLAAGADAYISKPVDIDKLITVVNQFFQHNNAD